MAPTSASSRRRPSSAQKVIDTLVDCGVKAILNYAPIAAQVPPSVHLKDIDPVLSLQSMTFYLKHDMKRDVQLAAVK